MRMVAYKTKDCPGSLVKDSLPDNWITEWTYTDLQPEGSLKVEDGWNFLNETEFNALLEYTNTEEALSQFAKAKHEAEEAEYLARLQANVEKNG